MHRFALVLALIVAATGVASADPASDVRNALIAFSKLSSYHASMQSHGRSVEGDFVKPDRMQMTMGPMQMIQIGGTMYMNQGGKWTSMTSPGTAMMGPMASARDFSKFRDNAKVTDLGPKVIGGLAYHAYRVQASGNHGPATLFVNNGILTRIEVFDANGTSTIQFSKFNAPIKISAPI